MTLEKKTVALLCATQALLFTNNTILIAVNGLAGFALAADKSLATLPVTSYVVGAALTTLPVSHLMRRIGRVNGFSLGTLIGILGALICGYAVYSHSFWTLCLGTLVMGIYNASGQYYRFAAADVASPDFKSTAISLVMAGGLVGGVLGPQTSKMTKDFLGTEFLATYLVLIGFCVVALALQRLMSIPRLTAAEQREHGRPLREIARQPAFLVAVLSGMVGYGVMNLLMTATPLAMGLCGHPYDAAAFVIQWHVIGMFAPSFFTGSLIKRYGVLPVMSAGVALEALCVGIALSGVLVANFWWALLLLGIGWNFLYVGGTTLLTDCYRVSEKAKAQGTHDFLVFLTTATSSFSSGLLMNRNGWAMLNYAAIPVLAVIGAAIVWLALQRRAAAA